jgi:transcriptional regulator with XRE-family HTH domain
MPTLREARTGQVLTIRDIAAKAGVSTKTVVDLEAGRAVPKFRTIRKLASALGVNPEDITEFRNAIDAARAGSADATTEA